MKDDIWDLVEWLAPLVLAIAVLAAIVIFCVWLLNTVISGAGTIVPVSGVVTKTYTLSCQSCEHGYAVINGVDGKPMAIEMSGVTYGLVNVGDYCTFQVGNFSYANSVQCEPTKDR